MEIQDVTSSNTSSSASISEETESTSAPLSTTSETPTFRTPSLILSPRKASPLPPPPPSSSLQPCHETRPPSTELELVQLGPSQRSDETEQKSSPSPLPPPTAPISPVEPAWTAQEEIMLFHSLLHEKPVGFDRHVRMIFIHRRFDSRWRMREPALRVPERVTADMLWRKLETLYNLAALNFENQTPAELMQVRDFELPAEEFEATKKELMTSSSSSSSCRTSKTAKPGRLQANGAASRKDAGAGGDASHFGAVNASKSATASLPSLGAASKKNNRKSAAPVAAAASCDPTMASASGVPKIVLNRLSKEDVAQKQIKNKKKETK